MSIFPDISGYNVRGSVCIPADLDASEFVATALVVRAFRAAGLHHLLRGAQGVVALTGVPAEAGELVADCAGWLLRGGARGAPSCETVVHDCTGTRGKRRASVGEVIDTLRVAQRLLCVFETVDDVPAGYAIAADGIAAFQQHDAEILRAAAMRIVGTAPPIKVLEELVGLPLPLLSTALAKGRSPSSSASLARRIRDARIAEETAEKISDAKAPTSIVKMPPGPTIEQLHGLGEAGEWARSLAVDLADYKAGAIGWSEVDRGALVSGPPGTGKTTFAVALARSCGVPVFVHSLARWQAAGYLNALLKDMRAAFEEAVAAAPCILFVDELDSFGDRASSDDHNARYAREVINGFLECLDGARGREGVVVLGATNHPHLIDPAIRRSGRLDRELRIPLPDAPARHGILRHHLRGDLEAADLASVADETAGMSGADIERLVREARRSARGARRPMSADDLKAALPTPVVLSEDAFRRICVHEAGHFVVGAHLAKLSGAVPIQAVVRREIRSASPNQTEFAHVVGLDRTRASELATVAVLLAGMAAEQVVLGDRGTLSGGSEESDLARATLAIARIEYDWGLGDSLVVTDRRERSSVGTRLDADPCVRRRVDGLLRECLERAIAIVVDRLAEVEAVSRCLAAKGTWPDPKSGFAVAGFSPLPPGG